MERLKTCTQCKIQKSILDFSKNHNAKDGLYSWCKPCNRVKARALYARKSHVYKACAKKHRIAVSKELRAQLLVIKAKYGCAFCEEKEICTLEFHHVNPRKDAGGRAVSHAVSRGRGVFIREVNKCVVLCANCHKKVHAGLRIVTPHMLCNEPVVYKKRVFLKANPVKRCVISKLFNGDWLILET